MGVVGQSRGRTGADSMTEVRVRWFVVRGGLREEAARGRRGVRLTSPFWRP